VGDSTELADKTSLGAIFLFTAMATPPSPNATCVALALNFSLTQFGYKPQT
jgi:hypothetical protein